jgi:predicted transposase YbfD/YdcC
MKAKKIQTISKSQKMDTTDYLFSSQANKKRLLQAIENADTGENLTEIGLDDLKKQFSLGQIATLGKLEKFS